MRNRKNNTYRGPKKQTSRQWSYNYPHLRLVHPFGWNDYRVGEVPLNVWLRTSKTWNEELITRKEWEIRMCYSDVRNTETPEHSWERTSPLLSMSY